jgi:hypothetical protein
MKIAVAVLSTTLFIAILVTLQRHGAQSQAAGTPANAWWTDRQAGLVGGLAGSVVGILGGVVGSLAGFGKARKFVLGLVAALIALGVASLIAGVVALAVSQPYAVYYPLLLMGFLCTLIFGFNFPMIRRRYAERELRKMEALDK